MWWHLVELLEEAFHVEDPVGKMVEQVEQVEVDCLYRSRRPKCHHHQDQECHLDGMCDEQV